MGKTENYSLKRESGQSVSEMEEQLTASHSGKMYSVSADEDVSSRALFIRGLVEDAVDSIGICFPEFGLADDMQIRRGKVDLNDLEEVAAVSRRFMAACAKSGTIPSFSLLAPALGYSRIWLYDFMRRKKTTTVEFLGVLQTAFAGILEQVTLARRCSEAGGIFVLKNSGQGYSDRAELTISNDRGTPFDEMNRNPEEIAKRYLAGMAGSNENIGEGR